MIVSDSTTRIEVRISHLVNAGPVLLHRFWKVLRHTTEAQNLDGDLLQEE